MTTWRWIHRDTVMAVHDAQLAQHGGLDGVKDANLVDSALARPERITANREPPPDVFDLAAAYGYGIVKNHGFSDGNKRTGWILTRLFLADNDIKIRFTAQDAIEVMLGVTSGLVSESEFAQWLRKRKI